MAMLSGVCGCVWGGKAWGDKYRWCVRLVLSNIEDVLFSFCGFVEH